MDESLVAQMRRESKQFDALCEIFGEPRAFNLWVGTADHSKAIESKLGAEGFKKFSDLSEELWPDDQEPRDSYSKGVSRWARSGLRAIGRQMVKQMGVEQGDMASHFFTQAAQPDAEHVDVAGAVFGWDAADKALAHTARRDKAHQSVGRKFWNGATHPQLDEESMDVMSNFFPAGPTKKARR